MVPETPRKAGPYRITATSLEFPFSFYMISGDDVVVTINDLDGNDVELDKQYYTVTLNSSQKTTPGGVVTLKQSIETLGTALAITSGMPYTQNLDLHNSGNFNPVVINKEEDRRVIQLQQLLEELKRCIIVPVTSAQTREELLQNLLDIANTANEYAQKAEQILKETQEVKAEIQTLQPDIEAAVTQTGEAQVERVETAGGEQVSAIVAEGDKQVVRLEAIADFEEAGHGVLCTEQVWTITQEVASGTTITLPNYMSYVVGRNHLRVNWNGLTLVKSQNFMEVGDADTDSTEIIINMPLHIGDRIMVWTVPLGRGLTDEIISRVTDLESALADLSRKVVYKEEEVTE